MVIAIKTIFVLAILAAFSLALSGCIGSGPSLSVENVSGNDRLGLTTGCYSTISGTVKNNGGASAEEAIVSCSTTQEGLIIGTESANIGSISAGNERNFSLDVDTDCLKGDVAYNCTADCSNC